jgi:hypothetical protein
VQKILPNPSSNVIAGAKHVSDTDTSCLIQLPGSRILQPCFFCFVLLTLTGTKVTNASEYGRLLLAIASDF